MIDWREISRSATQLRDSIVQCATTNNGGSDPPMLCHCLKNYCCYNFETYVERIILIINPQRCRKGFSHHCFPFSTDGYAAFLQVRIHSLLSIVSFIGACIQTLMSPSDDNGDTSQGYKPGRSWLWKYSHAPVWIEEFDHPLGAPVAPALVRNQATEINCTCSIQSLFLIIMQFVAMARLTMCHIFLCFNVFG